jgi:Ca2+ transporting ATPase
MESPWASSPLTVLQHFNVEPSRGLTSHQAAKHAEIYGINGTFIPVLSNVLLS